ncbi:hypothetical protein ACHAQA_006007 [Verticillium albo-atrum]
MSPKCILGRTEDYNPRRFGLCFDFGTEFGRLETELENESLSPEDKKTTCQDIIKGLNAAAGRLDLPITLEDSLITEADMLLEYVLAEITNALAEEDESRAAYFLIGSAVGMLLYPGPSASKGRARSRLNEIETHLPSIMIDPVALLEVLRRRLRSTGSKTPRERVSDIKNLLQSLKKKKNRAVTFVPADHRGADDRRKLARGEKHRDLKVEMRVGNFEFGWASTPHDRPKERMHTMPRTLRFSGQCEQGELFIQRQSWQPEDGGPYPQAALLGSEEGDWGTTQDYYLGSSSGQAAIEGTSEGNKQMILRRS